jgi:iron-sulfur cluster assembly protein
METTVITPVSLTQGATAELKNIWHNENLPADYALRIGVKGGGCAGMEYILGFDAVKDGDDLFEINGIRCAMNRAHGLYLMGMEIDYVNGLNNRGFIFNNPNAKNTCGCGTSFSA